MIRHSVNRVTERISKNEGKVLALSAGWFFLVLSSYYVLRPIREAISTDERENLNWLFFATFVVMLIAIPTYSYLVSKFHRRKLVPSVYGFFVTCLLLFWGAMTFVPDTATIASDVTVYRWVARVLFVWISIYGLFIVSFFWSVVGDLYTNDQGRRLFGLIFGAGTLGGLASSLTTSFLVMRIQQSHLLLIPAVLLTAGLVVYLRLERQWQNTPEMHKKEGGGKATGGNPFAGFTAVFSSKYLFAICVYGFLLAACGTTIYFQQSEIVNAAYDTKEEKTSYFATVNFFVQLLTFVLQTVVVGRLMKRFGLAVTLALLPLAYIVGITSLAIAPTLAVLAVISVTGRSAEYAIANPAREVLFTAVAREERYKAKSFIDTIVRRGGDSIVGTIYRTLRESWEIAMTTLSWAVLPIACLWVGLAVFIGRQNTKISATDETGQPNNKHVKPTPQDALQADHPKADEFKTSAPPKTDGGKQAL